MTNNNLYFCTNGPIDIEAAMTFGVSAKTTASAIGQFGTGLKYATAIVLRLGGSMVIEHTGKQETFTTKKKESRGQTFDLVMLNDVSLGFTTHLGSHWEPWHAYRELYSNCIDEGGMVTDLVYQANDYDTVIVVDCEALATVHKEKGKYFLEGEPCYTEGEVSFHKVMSGVSSMYYQRIQVHALPISQSFKVNILSKVDLTEDRTAAYPSIDILDKVAKAVQTSTNKEFIEVMLSARTDFESHLLYDKQYNTTNEFFEVCTELSAKGRNIPVAALLIKADKEAKSKSEIWEPLELSATNEIMLAKAEDYLEEVLGIEIEFPIKIVKGLGDGVMGRAYEEHIYLSSIPFELGTKQVASTLLEEWVHLEYQCPDFSRTMQNYLFNKIISLGEEIQGEPL